MLFTIHIHVHIVVTSVKCNRKSQVIFNQDAGILFQFRLHRLYRNRKISFLQLNHFRRSFHQNKKSVFVFH